MREAGAQRWSLFWGAIPGRRTTGRRGRSRSGYTRIPPLPHHQSGGKLRLGAPACLALAGAACANKSFDTDVLAAGVARLWSAGQLQR
jgi:hypothetical protein